MQGEGGEGNTDYRIIGKRPENTLPVGSRCGTNHLSIELRPSG